MVRVSAGIAGWLIAATACGSAPPMEPRSAPPEAGGSEEPRATPMTAPVTASRELPATPVAAPGGPWIETERVGDVELGKRLPEALLEDRLEARYVARYVADAQAVDAFVFEEPPMTIWIEGGPWSAAAKRRHEAARPDSARYRAKAAELARAGAVVRAILVTATGPRTRAGVGVGDTLDDLRQAYADAQTAARPETLGKDQCVARTQALPGVSFVFASCGKAARGEPITRIDLLR